MRYLCQDDPDLLELETGILDARPGAILADRFPFFPGGGGQLPDRGTIEWAGGRAGILGFEPSDRGIWILHEPAQEPSGTVRLSVDRAFRSLMCELHTVAHLVNCVVYRDFDGALLTGAQLSADGMLRVDFDLPGADTERLRGLAPAVNDLIKADAAVRGIYMPRAEAESIPGMFRSKAVAPPVQPDGMVRIVDIVGIDRQACGGTHLGATGMARPVRILKVDNKGKHNRRLKVGFSE